MSAYRNGCHPSLVDSGDSGRASRTASRVFGGTTPVRIKIHELASRFEPVVERQRGDTLHLRFENKLYLLRVGTSTLSG
jgi:hypothetical protein